MTRRRTLCVACLSLLCTYSGLGAAVFSSAAEPRVRLVVVVQKSSPLSELSLRDLKRLYLGEYLTDADGKKLMALNHPPQSPDRIGFDQVVLKLTPDEAGRFWIDRKIRGQPAAPRSVAPRELLRKFVATSPGAVTYLRAGEVDPELKALTIDGKRPDAADYPLQY